MAGIDTAVLAFMAAHPALKVVAGLLFSVLAYGKSRPKPWFNKQAGPTGSEVK